MGGFEQEAYYRRQMADIEQLQRVRNDLWQMHFNAFSGAGKADSDNNKLLLLEDAE